MCKTKFRISTRDIEIINTINFRYINDNEEIPDYYAPTLKDAAIYLYQMCGQGVHWQLSRELSERTECDLITINKALSDIISEYANMSDESAIEKFENDEGYIEHL